ncbi:3-oxoacyl-[acyl-carrier-protein] synthase, KASII [hydrothermal vent metagenome]|uniref:3-oxoacyl-[acyl-carrier-protein] synthase, KASII n=1 Tax=hydrothermal vent metagenome TaxID=652676 RepID=A0A3B1C762_9ZZZZ
MKNVVITGLGAVTPLGIGVDETWKNIVAGRSGIRPITRFDASEYPVRIAGEVQGFNPLDFIDAKEAKKMDTFIHYAIAGAYFALEDAGINTGELTNKERERIGVILGTGIGGLPEIERTAGILIERGPRRVSPFFIPAVLANLAAGQVSIKFGLKGVDSCPVTACATGSTAIGDASRIIERGDADVVVAGGAEAAISGLGIAGFAASKALSKRNDEPERASRPFDSDRDGFVMGEGSGVMILESLEHAEARGAKIYAEVVGYGMSSDAHHITAPPPGGDGAVACMNHAIRDSGVDREKIGYINAHATSTMADAIETKAIKSVFGDAAADLAISSTKSMIGHLLGAAGGVEAIFAVKVIETGIIPPTINLDNPDPACDLFYVPNKAIERKVDYALSNSFGFGGVNASLVFARHES